MPSEDEIKLGLKQQSTFVDNQRVGLSKRSQVRSLNMSGMQPISHNIYITYPIVQVVLSLHTASFKFPHASSGQIPGS